jgi:hypothetical protein
VPVVEPKRNVNNVISTAFKIAVHYKKCVAKNIKVNHLPMFCKAKKQSLTFIKTKLIYKKKYNKNKTTRQGSCHQHCIQLFQQLTSIIAQAIVYNLVFFKLKLSGIRPRCDFSYSFELIRMHNRKWWDLLHKLNQNVSQFNLKQQVPRDVQK